MKYAIVSKNDSKSIDASNYLKKSINLEYDDVNPDIVIAIGGDGTILKALHDYIVNNEKIILFGVHSGHLGFYANYKIDALDVLVNDINNSCYKTENVNLLSYQVITKNNSFEGLALNEVTIINPPRTLILDVYIDDVYLEKFRGTGLCMSTQYGSTAYNKSLHGSVIDTGLKTIQLTEIAAINSNAYRTLSSPYVLNERRVITLNSTFDQEIWVTIDNVAMCISDFLSMKCMYDGHFFKMAYNGKYKYIDRVKRAFL